MTTIKQDTDKDPSLFSQLFLKILDKNDNLIPFNWNSIQKDFHSEKSGRDLVLKSRQVGISTYEQGEIFRNLITKTTRAATLCHIDSSTQILRQTAERFYENFPKFEGISKPQRNISNNVMSRYPETDSSHIIGTAGNTEFGRGGSFSMFHGSEVAFWKDAERIVAGVLQAGNPQIVLESTPNGAQGYFYELCMDSISRRNNWKLHFYPWYKHPEYVMDGEEVRLDEEEKFLKLSQGQARWRRNKRVELKRLFSQEYPENITDCFLTSGNGFFSDIQVSYSAPLKVERNHSHQYTGGLDFGQSNDFTCMIILDRTTRQMVDYLHINKMSWSLQRLEIKRMYEKWRLAGLRAERNSIGSVNIEELQKDGINLEAFDTTNSSKSTIFNRLHEELESGLELQDWNILRGEMNTLTSKQTPSGLWTVSASDNNHDDTPMALALAITAKLSLDNPMRVWY